MITRRSLLASMLGSIAAAPVFPAFALDDIEIDGLYRSVPVQPVQDPTRIELLEVFWYRCPHCYAFQPYMERYLAELPEDVNFRRMPAVLRDSWVPQAKIYYAAQALGVLERLHRPIFDAIHKARRPMSSRAEIKTFFVENGVDAARFDAAFDSFSVDAKVRQSDAQTKRYGITGVPAVVINGRYRTSGQLAGSYENVMKVIKALIETERERLAKSA